MRIWSLHPSLLDRRALVACWRETLLAQKVLRGLTRGYTNHPQLIRFRAHPQPLEAVAAYLSGLAACAHPLFEVVPGAIEPWEKTKGF